MIQTKMYGSYIHISTYSPVWKRKKLERNYNYFDKLSEKGNREMDTQAPNITIVFKKSFKSDIVLKLRPKS